MDPISNEEIYREFLNSNYSEATQVSYSRNLSFIRKMIGCEVYEANPKQLEKFILDCRDDRNLTGGTIQTYKAVIGSFFKYLIKHNHRSDDPSILALEVDSGNKNKNIPKTLNEEQIEKVYRSLIWDGSIYEYQI